MGGLSKWWSFLFTLHRSKITGYTVPLQQHRDTPEDAAKWVFSVCVRVVRLFLQSIWLRRLPNSGKVYSHRHHLRRLWISKAVFTRIARSKVEQSNIVILVDKWLSSRLVLSKVKTTGRSGMYNTIFFCTHSKSTIKMARSLPFRSICLHKVSDASQWYQLKWRFTTIYSCSRWVTAPKWCVDRRVTTYSKNLKKFWG